MVKPRTSRIDFNVPEPLKKLAEMAAARENYDTLSEYLRAKLWELVNREMNKDEQTQFLKLLYPDVEIEDINADPDEMTGPPANYRLGFRESRDVRPAGQPRRLILRPDEKTGTG